MLKFFQQTDLERVPSSEQNIMISGSQLLNRVLLSKILFNITNKWNKQEQAYAKEKKRKRILQDFFWSPIQAESRKVVSSLKASQFYAR